MCLVFTCMPGELPQLLDVPLAFMYHVFTRMPGASHCSLRMWLWWEEFLYLALLACQVTVNIGDWGLYCCVCVTSFERCDILWRPVKMYLRWSLYTLYLHACQMRVTIATGCSSGGVYILCICAHARWELPFNVFVVALVWYRLRTNYLPCVWIILTDHLYMALFFILCYQADSLHLTWFECMLVILMIPSSTQTLTWTTGSSLSICDLFLCIDTWKTSVYNYRLIWRTFAGSPQDWKRTLYIMTKHSMQIFRVGRFLG